MRFALTNSLLILQVDRAFAQATEAYKNNAAYLQAQLERQKQFHSQNLESYNAARQQYLKKVEESVDFLKSNGLAGTAKVAAEEVMTKVKEAQKVPGAVLKNVQESVDKLLSAGPVTKAVETVRPGLDAAWSRYLSVHDSVVASAQYKKTLTLAETAFTKAQETILYQKAKENFWPVLKPYADPALDAIFKSSTYQAAVQHLAPKA